MATGIDHHMRPPTSQALFVLGDSVVDLVFFAYLIVQQPVSERRTIAHAATGPLNFGVRALARLIP